MGCRIVRAERARPSLTAMLDARRGMGQTAVFLVPNVDGRKMVRSANVGFEAFSMFRAKIQSHRTKNPLALSVIPRRRADQMDMVVLGGKSFQNVLLQQSGLEAERVTVVMKVGQCQGVRLRMDLVPLIYEDDALRTREMRQCIVDRQHVD